MMLQAKLGSFKGLGRSSVDQWLATVDVALAMLGAPEFSDML